MRALFILCFLCQGGEAGAEIPLNHTCKYPGYFLKVKAQFLADIVDEIHLFLMDILVCDHNLYHILEESRPDGGIGLYEGIDGILEQIVNVTLGDVLHKLRREQVG